MLIYIIVFAAALFLFSISRIEKKMKICNIVALSIIIFFSGIRYGVGIDYHSYWEIASTIENSDTEKGFWLLCSALNYIGFGPQAMFFVTSIAFVILIYKSIRFYENKYIVYSLFVFLFGGLFIESLSGVRQYLAIAIFFYASRYVVNRSLFKYLIAIGIAALFHTSSFFLIPFYWILNIKYRSNTLLVILILSVALSFVFPLKSLMERIPYYGNYVTIFSDANPTANLGLGYLSKMIIALLAVAFRKKILSKHPTYFVVVNGVVFYVALMSLFKDFIVFLRLSYYFQIFVVILLPTFLSIVSFKSRSIVLGIIVCYCIMLFYIILGSASAMYVPYDYNFDLFYSTH